MQRLSMSDNQGGAAPDDATKKVAEQAAYIVELETEHEAVNKKLLAAEQTIAEREAAIEQMRGQIVAAANEQAEAVDTSAQDAKLAAAAKRIAELEAMVADKPAVMPEPKEGQPAAIRVTHAHGYIEDGTNRNRYWPTGTIVSDPREIALLIERGALIEPA
jgi:hypothetical protein